MLTTLAAPAFAETWYIENGDITVKASGTEGKNTVSQGNKKDVEDTNTIITNQNKDKASSNTVTIDAGNDKVEVTLDNVNIKTDSGSALTSKGDVTLALNGDNHLTGGISGTGNYGRNGIASTGSLTISGGENDSLTAQGGSGTYDGGSGIYSNGSLTLSGGTVNANGGNGSNDRSSSGGSGIHIFGNGSLTVSDGTVTATGGNGGTGDASDGGSGISGSGSSGKGSLTVSGGTVNATGGNSGNGDFSDGGSGINISDVTVSGGTVTATGGNGGTGDYSDGGSGIYSNSGGVTISGGTVTAAGGSSGNGINSYGGSGIHSVSGSIAISGGTVEAAGGVGKNGSGGSGIYSSVIDLSGSLELTAKAGSPTGKALLQNGRELDLDTIKDKLGPGAKVTAINANGDSKQVSIPRPVEPEKPVIPEEPSSSSDGGSSAPSAPASSLPGLTVTDKDGQRISYTSTQSGNTLTVCVGRFTASLRISLSTLRQLRAEGIETITFQTILCSTTLSVDELLAMGGEDAEAVLTHRLTDSSLTVG